MISIPDYVSKFITEAIVLTITGLICVITVLLRKKIIDSLIQFISTKFKFKIYKQVHLAKRDIERDIKLQDILADLRIRSAADRCYILQFHNGSVFSAKNQMWRLTCTHESLNNGIRPAIGSLQNILSSSISDIIYPLWLEDVSSINGVQRVSPAVCSCANKEQCHLPKGVFLVTINKLSESYSKGILMSEAVKYLMATPILDEDANRIGILALDYCWEDADTKKIVTHAERLCQTASQISFELRSK